MGLLALQLFSVAGAASLPLLMGLAGNYRDNLLYAILFCSLTVNAHTTLQQKDFSNPNYKLNIQSLCFIIMFLLSAFTHYTYSIKKPMSDK